MRGYCVGRDYLNPLVLKKTADDLIKVVDASEKDEHLRENMISDKPWSLLSILMNPQPEYKKDLFFCMTYGGPEDDESLTSISCGYRTENPYTYDESKTFMRIACRLWLHPSVRRAYVPTFYHINEAQQHAKELGYGYVWTSFNEDRLALGERILRLQKNSNSQVRGVWEDWQLTPGLHEINGVYQSLAWAQVN